MPSKNPGTPGRATCDSCRQCETCCQESMNADAVAAPGDDTSPPPYEQAAPTPALHQHQHQHQHLHQHQQHRQGNCRYNTFDEGRPPPSPALRRQRRNYDIESDGSTPRGADRDAADERRGMAAIAVMSAVIVMALWLIFGQIANLKAGRGGIYWMAHRDFWEVLD